MAEALLRSLTVKDDEDFIDPWTVTGKSETGIDYDKLIRKYGSYCIEETYSDLSILGYRQYLDNYKMKTTKNTKYHTI